MNQTVERDKRYRRNALGALKLARGYAPSGRLSGVALNDHANSPLAYDQKVEDEQLALSLLRDLVTLGYADEQKAEARLRGQPLKLKNLSFGITALGVRLYDANAPVDPMVWDERAED